jgi:hypothetical protein
MVGECHRRGKTASISWVKGHEATPGNERAGVLAGKATEKSGHAKVVSLAHLKLRISGRFKTAKTVWHEVPSHHGTEEIPPPLPKKSCLDRTRNALARTVAQIRLGHWRSAVYLKRIRRWPMTSQGLAKMTRSHVLLHCPNEKLRAARAEAWEGKNHGGVRVLLANPRWERWLVKFLELSGVGRVMADGTDEDGARMDECVVWDAVERAGRGVI